VRLARPSTRTLVTAGVALVVVAAVAAGGWYWYDTQQRHVAAAYAAALTRVYTAQGQQASTDARARAAQQLEEVIARYPSGADVAEAAFELGNLRYATAQYGAARGAYEIALTRAAGRTVRTLARSSIGYTWEAERNFPKAIEAYQALVADLGPKDFLYEQALLDLARAQELAGRPAEAIATYQRLLKDVPAARRADEARARLTALGGTAAPPSAPGASGAAAPAPPGAPTVR
jgi:tetratricopeptide (TPR) repeat protein